MIVKFFRTHARQNIKPLYLATAALFALSFILPFSYPLVALLFLLLSLYVVSLRISSTSKSVEEVNVSLLSGVNIIDVNQSTTRRNDLALPLIITVISLGFIAYSLFFLVSKGEMGPRGLFHFMTADMLFAQSLKPESLTSGQKTYELQIEAIETYPYRADFYRIFSQINIALATNLVNSQADAPTVSEEVQQAIIQQLQQAINASRQSVIYAPESSLNWRSLGQVYRNLIGVGQDAEQFAIASYNQAISLEPNNPALRIELGGIYYQLQEYDLAQNQFQVAAGLKRDYANAYYNLGHALEEKGQLAVALQQYQIVKQLVQNDENSAKLMTEEIEALQTRIGSEGAQVTPEVNVEPTEETGLELQDQSAQFPERDPLEQIPAPPAEDDVDAPQPSPSTTPAQ